jgi:ATP-dependent Lhr-like helicase
VVVPKFLDDVGVRLLTDARETFDQLALRHHSLWRHDDRLLLFPWVGHRAQMALILALASHDITAASHGIAVSAAVKYQDALVAALTALAQAPAPDAAALARLVPDTKRAKYDGYLGDDLLARSYASERIDAASVPTIAANLLVSLPYP